MQAFRHFFIFIYFFYMIIVQKIPKICVNEKLSIVKNDIPFPLYVGSKLGKFIKCAIFFHFYLHMSKKKCNFATKFGV